MTIISSFPNYAVFLGQVQINSSICILNSAKILWISNYQVVITWLILWQPLFISHVKWTLTQSLTIDFLQHSTLKWSRSASIRAELWPALLVPFELFLLSMEDSAQRLARLPLLAAPPAGAIERPMSKQSENVSNLKQMSYQSSCRKTLKP